MINEIHRQTNQAGYRLRYYQLNAAHFGIPQARVRVYFVGLRKGSKYDFSEITPEMRATPLKDYLLPETEMAESDYVKLDWEWRTSKHYQNGDKFSPGRVGLFGSALSKRSHQRCRVFSTDFPAPTQMAGHDTRGNTGVYFIPRQKKRNRKDGKIRRLHITEAKRVMGFPDDFILSPGTRAYQQMGNAVIPKMVQVVFNSIVPA